MLPYIEEGTLHDLGAGLTRPGVPVKENDAKLEAGTQIAQHPLPILHCPSRRPAKLYPHRDSRNGYVPIVNTISLKWESVAKTDYAANAGDSVEKFDSLIRGRITVGTYEAGDDPNYYWPRIRDYPGVICHRTEVPVRKITDGTSHTYMVGEKYLSPDDYEINHYFEDDSSSGDGGPAFTGVGRHDVRFTAQGKYEGDYPVPPPRQDSPGFSNLYIFGSAHPGGFHMTMCDGSVHTISYDIEAEVHRRLGNRMDGEPVDLGGF